MGRKRKEAPEELAREVATVPKEIEQDAGAPGGMPDERTGDMADPMAPAERAGTRGRGVRMVEQVAAPAPTLGASARKRCKRRGTRC